MLKAFVACTLSGFVCFVSSNLYTGATNDSVILEHSKFLPFLQQYRKRAFVDGGFKKSDLLIIPHRATAIWPKKPLGKSRSAYEQEALTKLQYNENIAHFRSRIEHVFGRTFIGRWLALKNWTHSFDLAFGDCFKAALIIHNLEAYLRYEWGGKFPRF